MWEILAKNPFSAKMTGHKMLIVTGHFVVEINGMAQTISIDFLGNDHHGVFLATRSSYMLFLTAKINWSSEDQKSACGLSRLLRFVFG